ncbi:hypothetical protein ANO11243_048880 [Dothideomycetidae sp. 11243]|nr:hypothetical protein ANO11243_048880 [fungal sp. No.11243]
MSTFSGPISLPSTSLHITLTHPPFQNPHATTPLIIFESGSGTPAQWFAPLARLLSLYARVLHYSRAGLGQSGPSTLARSAANMASELVGALQTLRVEGPYVLVAHSYGCVIARETLALLGKEVHGAVFVEGNTPRSLRELALPKEAVEVFAGLDYLSVVGLRDEHVCTEEEWEGMVGAGGYDSPAAAAEAELFLHSARVLEAKKQVQRQVLGEWPVTVIRGNAGRDIRRLQNAARRKGKGTVEQHRRVDAWRERFEALDEELQRTQMGLSRRAKFVQAMRSGHHVHVTEPELVVEAILGILKTAS